MEMRELILRKIYQISPFDLMGDLDLTCIHKNSETDISCLIISRGRRLDDLERLLFSLSQQTLNRESFEVILLNDGGGHQVLNLIRGFEKKVNIFYLENLSAKGYLGENRNRTVENAHGEYLVFLDDDTRILRNDFLENVLRLTKESDPDVIMPKATASYGLVKEKYDFLDEHSYSARCCIHKRSNVVNIGGFVDNMTTFEDIELGIRMMIKGVNVLKTEKIMYFHPPLYFENMNKPYTIGQSICRLKQRYSLPVWFIVYLNSLRFLVFIFIPDKIKQQWLKISLGVLAAPFIKEEHYY